MDRPDRPVRMTASQIAGGLAVITTLGIFLYLLAEADLTFGNVTILEFGLAGGIIGLAMGKARSGPLLGAALLAVPFLLLMADKTGVLYLPPLLLLVWASFKHPARKGRDREERRGAGPG